VPLYIKKSIIAGPFRFNFSKGGIGASVGVKGFRIGTGPKGHYVHAGRGGIYYRASLGSSMKDSGLNRQPASPVSQVPPVWESGVDMVEIESGSVNFMQEETFSDFLDDLNKKQRQPRMAVFFLVACLIFSVFGFLVGPQFGIPMLLVSIPGWLFGDWLDSFRRVSVLFYELEKDREDDFAELTRCYDCIRVCIGKWHIEAGGTVKDLTTWKRNAGASHIVKKSPTEVDYKLPRVLKSNVTPPAIKVGKQILYFLPDVVLVEDGGAFGLVEYSNLDVRWQDSNFIEDGFVPLDAQVIGQTWKHPNKNGGPDRRFSDNKQIPICRYEVMHFTSKSGINELVEVSKTGVCAGFARAISVLGKTVAIGRS
jgi:Protein of unknown function (DUF4236)